MSYTNYKFNLKPLPYDYSALEPYIDEETVKLHHNKHLKTYVDNLNKALENYKELWDWPLEKLIKYSHFLPICIQTDVRNNAGGVYNHNFYFDIMTPNSTGEPIGNLKKEILKTFGSFDNFKLQLKNCALKRFGSGYAWLVKNAFGKLNIISTANQEAPLLLGIAPILFVDVWEHAYYLKYKNRRDKYVDNWFNLIDWEKCEKKYNE